MSLYMEEREGSDTSVSRWKILNDRIRGVKK